MSRPLAPPQTAPRSRLTIDNKEDFQGCSLIIDKKIILITHSNYTQPNLLVTIRHFRPPNLSSTPWQQSNGMHIDTSISPVETATAHHVLGITNMDSDVGGTFQARTTPRYAPCWTISRPKHLRKQCPH